MLDAHASFYDSLIGVTEKIPKVPSEPAVRFIRRHQLPGQYVLTVGGGGRHAIYMARQGIRVLAQDIRKADLESTARRP